ncbi:MAG: leucine-rich repeat protein [Bacteroidaceae bacterium]|nr:leucine-rich repeat protein [Bacteroidaceae bacterium]
MKLKSILFTGIAALALAGCTQETDEIPQQSASGNTFAINLEGSISQEYETRVDDGGFCDGDQIGLYGVNYTDDNATQGALANNGNQVDNARYTYDGKSGKWTSSGSIYYKDVNTNIDLYAYYPYASPSSVNEYAFEVAQDQSGKGVTDGYAMSDFLWAMAENVKPSENAVKLRFTHRLSCANVVLAQGDGFADGEFEKLNKTVLAMNTTRTANINLATGAATATGKPTSEGIVMMNDNDGFRAIVVPQTVKANAALFSITIDGVVYRFKKENDFIYEPGKQSKFTITINKKEMSGEYEFVLTGCEIVDWIADLATHGGEARQYYVVKQEKAGTLGKLLREAKKNPNKIKNLKISGKIDASDFYFMRDSMEILQAINLKECEIMEVGIWDEWSNENHKSANEIPNGAFNEKSSLVFFVFPEYVTQIGINAFSNTTLSGALIIPDDVTEIGGWAFSGTNISSLQLSTNLRILKDNAFRGCSSLSGSLSLPESIEEIGQGCFYECRMLTGNLILPSKLRNIPEFAFSRCGFTGDLIIPEGVTEIGFIAFENCKFNGQLKLPTSLKKMGESSFTDCKFQGELVIPAQIKSIPFNCFYQNEFSSIVFEEESELVKIEAWAFYCNLRLSEPIVFPEGLMTIGESAFWRCDMPSVTIPSNVTIIGENAFTNCYNITSLQCNATTPPVVGSGAFDGVPKDNFTLQVPESSVPLYQTANGWSDFKRIAANHDFSISRKHIRTLNAEYSKTYLLRAPSGEPWSIESCPSWVTVTPQSGVGRCDVTVTVDEMKASETGMFTREEVGTYGEYIIETHNGRSGEIVFLLDNKDARTTMAVEQYDSERSDGEVIVNQRATKGAGVDIVFMGDCFDARDIAMESYISGINEAIGYYFAIEPYKSYRDYFNVYTVVGMSDDS